MVDVMAGGHKKRETMVGDSGNWEGQDEMKDVG